MQHVTDVILPSDLVGYKVRKLHNRLTKQWTHLSNKMGLQLSAVQAGILVFIDVKSGLTQKDLAELLRVDASTLSQALLPLLDRGLIRKYPDTEDRRKLQMILSEDGKNLIDDISAVFSERQKNVPGNLSPKELRTLHALLDKMIT